MTQAISPITTTSCPQAIAAANRKTRNRKREQDPAVRALVKAWCVGKVCSCGCGRPANMAHHPTDDLYASDIRYLNLDECEPFFHTCHHNMHHGLIRCPGCGGWMRQGSEKCAKCRGTVRTQKDRNGRIYKSTYKRRHPCLKNLGQQRCREKIVCPYSPRKAPDGCRAFVARKKEGGMNG